MRLLRSNYFAQTIKKCSHLNNTRYSTSQKIKMRLALVNWLENNHYDWWLSAHHAAVCVESRSIWWVYQHRHIWIISNPDSGSPQFSHTLCRQCYFRYICKKPGKLNVFCFVGYQFVLFRRLPILQVCLIVLLLDYSTRTVYKTALFTLHWL